MRGMGHSKHRLLSFSVYVLPMMRTEEDPTWTTATSEARYTDIILYVSGSLALVVLLMLAGVYHRQATHGHHSRQPVTVQKLSRFPLARQVMCPCLPRPIPAPTLNGSQPDSSRQNESPTLQFSLESGSSGKSSLSLVRGVRLSSSGPPLLTGLVSLDLPLDPLWEFPRDRYTEQGQDGDASSRVVPTDLRHGPSRSPGWCSESPWVRAASGRWFVRKPSAWTPPSPTKPAPWR